MSCSHFPFFICDEFSPLSGACDFFFLWYELQVAFIRGADINLELVGIAGPSPVPQAEEAFYVPQLLQPALWKAVGFQPWRDVRLLILLTCANKWRWGEPPWAQPQK